MLYTVPVRLWKAYDDNPEHTAEIAHLAYERRDGKDGLFGLYEPAGGGRMTMLAYGDDRDHFRQAVAARDFPGERWTFTSDGLRGPSYYVDGPDFAAAFRILEGRAADAPSNWVVRLTDRTGPDGPRERFAVDPVDAERPATMTRKEHVERLRGHVDPRPYEPLAELFLKELKEQPISVHEIARQPDGVGPLVLGPEAMTRRVPPVTYVAVADPQNRFDADAMTMIFERDIDLQRPGAARRPIVLIYGADKAAPSGAQQRLLDRIKAAGITGSLVDRRHLETMGREKQETLVRVLEEGRMMVVGRDGERLAFRQAVAAVKERMPTEPARAEVR